MTDKFDRALRRQIEVLEDENLSGALLVAYKEDGNCTVSINGLSLPEIMEACYLILGDGMKAFKEETKESYN